MNVDVPLQVRYGGAGYWRSAAGRRFFSAFEWKANPTTSGFSPTTIKNPRKRARR